MMLGGTPPLEASFQSIYRMMTSYEPPFMPAYMTGSTSANVSGGSGSYTYQWSVRSGAASISGSSTSSSVVIVDHGVFPNSSSQGALRLVVSDGSSSVTVDGTYQLDHLTLM